MVIITSMCTTQNPLHYPTTEMWWWWWGEGAHIYSILWLKGSSFVCTSCSVSNQIKHSTTDPFSPSLAIELHTNVCVCVNSVWFPVWMYIFHTYSNCHRPLWSPLGLSWEVLVKSLLLPLLLPKQENEKRTCIDFFCNYGKQSQIHATWNTVQLKPFNYLLANEQHTAEVAFNTTNTTQVLWDEVLRKTFFHRLNKKN